MNTPKPVSPVERQILSIKLDAARKLAPTIRSLDVARMDSWQLAVDGTLAAGVKVQDLVERLCVSVSTLDRWIAGGVAPSAHARVNIRDTMADMIDEWVVETESRLSAEVAEEEDTVSPSP